MSPVRQGPALAVLATILCTTVAHSPLKAEESLNAISGSSASSLAFSGSSSGPVNYWWMGPNSPFALAYAEFKKCAASKGTDCGASAVYQPLPIPVPNHSAPGHQCQKCSIVGKIPSPGVDIASNPFLNGQFSSSSSAGGISSGGHVSGISQSTSCGPSGCTQITSQNAPCGSPGSKCASAATGSGVTCSGSSCKYEQSALPGSQVGVSCSGSSCGQYNQGSEGQYNQGFPSGSQAGISCSGSACGGLNQGFPGSGSQVGVSCSGSACSGFPGSGGSHHGFATSGSSAGSFSSSSSFSGGSSSGFNSQFGGNKPGFTHQFGGSSPSSGQPGYTHQLGGQPGSVSPGKPGYTHQLGGGQSSTYGQTNFQPGSSSQPGIKPNYQTSGSFNQQLGGSSNYQTGSTSGQSGYTHQLGEQPGHTTPGKPGYTHQLGEQPGSAIPGKPGYTHQLGEQPGSTSPGKPGYTHQFGEQPGSTIPGKPGYSHSFTGTTSSIPSGQHLTGSSQPSYNARPDFPGAPAVGFTSSFSGGSSSSSSFASSSSSSNHFGGSVTYTNTPFVSIPGSHDVIGVQPQRKEPEGDICRGPENTCVEKSLCVNGIAQIIDARIHQQSQVHRCDASTEVCCRLFTSSDIEPFEPDQQTQHTSAPLPGSSYSHLTSGSTAASTGGFTSNSFVSSKNEIPAENVQFPVVIGGTGPNSIFQQPALQPALQQSLNPSLQPSLTKGPAYIPPVGPSSQRPPASSTIPDLLPPYVPSSSTTPGLIHIPPSTQLPYQPNVDQDGSNINGLIHIPPKRPTTPQATYVPSTQFVQTTPVTQRPYTPTSTYATQRPYSPSSTYVTQKPYTPSYAPSSSFVTQTQRPFTYGPSSSYIPPSTTQRPYTPSYAPSSTIQQYRPTTQDQYKEGGSIQGQFIITTPHPGCAAALKCVPEDFCTAEGVASESRVSLTREQNENRVPLTSCKDLETGIIGKCCRDPTYKDPWPAGQLGLWNPNNGFDDGSYKVDNNGKYSKQPSSLQQLTAGSIGLPQRVPAPQTRPQTRPQTPLIRPGPQQTQFVQQSKYEPIPSASQQQPTCGIRRPGTKPRGHTPLDADFGEISWQAMVLRDTNRSLLCGGAIIKSNAVLTAAHCVDGLREDDVLIKGGEWRLGIDEEPKPFQIVKVNKISRHPGYEPGNLINDVAVLHLAEKLRLDTHIEPICMPTEAEIETARSGGASCITTGWGKEVLRINIANSLMHRMQVNVLGGDQCRNILQSQHPSDASKLDTNTCTCCTPAAPLQDICDTDPGSALACDLGDGHYKLTGVYSWDTGCGSQPQGTQQIASFAKLDVAWINSQLGTGNYQPLLPSYQQQPQASSIYGNRQTGNVQQVNQQYQEQQHYHHPNQPCNCGKK